MIFVTGATGNVGTPLLARLAAGSAPSVRALSRHGTGRSLPGVEWVKGDLDDVDALRPALRGIRTLVLISPANIAMQARETAIVDEARLAGVSRIVKMSGLGAGPDAPIRLPQAHFAVEQHIRSSGAAFTFVRPNLFYQTLLGSAAEATNAGTLHAAAGEGRISFTDVRDIAEVIAAAATSDQHDDQVYEITGPQALSYAEVCVALSVVVGHQVRHVDVSPIQQLAALLEAGCDRWTAEAFIELFGIYRTGHGASVLDVPIERITGRPARGLNDFLRDHASTFTKTAEPA